MIEVSLGELAALFIPLMGLLFVIGGFVWRLSHRLSTGSSKMNDLEKRIDRAEEASRAQAGDIKILEKQIMDKFSSLSETLTRVDTTVKLLYERVTEKKPDR